MRSFPLLALVACGPVDGTWVGDVEVEIFDEVVVHTFDLTLAEGTSQTGEPALEGEGVLTRRGTAYDVTVSGPKRGRRVEVDVDIDPSFYSFGQTGLGGYGGGEVRPNLSFDIDGRVAGDRLKGFLYVHEFGDTWSAPIRLERRD